MIGSRGTFARGLTGGRGGGGLLDAAAPSAEVIALLKADAAPYTWVAATVGSNNAAGFQLATELPHPDLVHVYTATSPGLHLLLAVFARLVSFDREAIEAFAALFSLAMILVAHRLLRRGADGIMTDDVRRVGPTVLGFRAGA